MKKTMLIHETYNFNRKKMITQLLRFERLALERINFLLSISPEKMANGYSRICLRQGQWIAS